MPLSLGIILNEPPHIIIKRYKRCAQRVVLENPISNRHQSFYTDHDLPYGLSYTRLVKLGLLLVSHHDMDALLRYIVLL